MSDPVNKPSHYAQLTPEPITVIEGWNLGYRLGNVLKYIARHRSKGATIQDLKKAQWYLAREIAALEAAEYSSQPVVAQETRWSVLSPANDMPGF
jgi:hypothetical protein